MDEIIVFLFVSWDYLYLSLEAFIPGHFNPFKQLIFHEKNFKESYEL